MVTGVFKLENDNCASCVDYFSVPTPAFHIALVSEWVEFNAPLDTI